MNEGYRKMCDICNQLKIDDNEYMCGDCVQEWKQIIRNQALEQLKNEVFKIYDWGSNHGNSDIISKRQLTRIIDQLKRGDKNE